MKIDLNTNMQSFVCTHIAFGTKKTKKENQFDSLKPYEENFRAVKQKMLKSKSAGNTDSEIRKQYRKVLNALLTAYKESGFVEMLFKRYQIRNVNRQTQEDLRDTSFEIVYDLVNNSYNPEKLNVRSYISAHFQRRLIDTIRERFGRVNRKKNNVVRKLVEAEDIEELKKIPPSLIKTEDFLEQKESDEALKKILKKLNVSDRDINIMLLVKSPMNYTTKDIGRLCGLDMNWISHLKMKIVRLLKKNCELNPKFKEILYDALTKSKK